MRIITLSTMIFSLFVSWSVFASVNGQPVLDCSCVQQDWKEAYDKANHVVFGEVKEVKVHNDDLATGPFIVMETFKGDADFVKQIVGSGKKEASCRKVLHPGHYIVFSEDDKNVVLNACVASRILRNDLVSTLTVIKKYSESGVVTGSANPLQGDKGGEQKESDWFQELMDWFESW